MIDLDNMIQAEEGEIHPYCAKIVSKKFIEVEGKTLLELINEYEELIIGVIKSRWPNSEQAAMYHYKPLIEWLRVSDFYTAPASTKYHDAYTGGLLVHTLNVYNNIMTLSQLPQFKSSMKDEDIFSAALIALVHDWCKIGLYESYEKNVKDESTGQWVKEQAWKHNQKGITLGHGVSSMFLISRFIKLTSDEALAIRWHMGKWNVSENEINELQKSNEMCPLVHLIQFADQLSITEYANKALGPFVDHYVDPNAKMQIVDEC